jgi:ABC-type nickel/cobalt efflux system permease component RcnA
VESTRGEIAAWLLIGFGLAYFVWGMRRAWKDKPHMHAHLHGHEAAHEHPHSPEHGVHEHVHSHEKAEHAHLHGEGKKANITPWVLFTIFVFGPCEPLIPLVMYPAARHSAAGVALVAAAFGLVTIATMLVIITAASWGARFVRLGKLERYSHALAGLMIFVSGLAVQFLGL